VIEHPADRHEFSERASDALAGAGIASGGRKRGHMTTALLLMIPVLATLILGVIARIVIGSEVPDLAPISSVWPTVIEALPPVELEHRDPVHVDQAA
jgi:hypothetical protein